MSRSLSSTSPKIPQLHALTGLRGIAAWFVVFYHIRLSLTALLPNHVIDGLAKGYLAVDLFFMLSGFVMWLNYGDRFTRYGLSETPRFLWKRIARIWPLHALILAGMCGFVLVLMVTQRPIEEFPLVELPLHFLLVQNWGFTDALSWNHPAWSISTELAAYLAFPLIVCALGWRQLGTAHLFAILIFSFAGIYAFFAMNGLDQLGDNIAQMGLIRCLIEFFIGIVLAKLWQHYGQGNRQTLAWLAAASGIAVLGFATGPSETAIFPAFIAATLMVFASNCGRLAGVMGSRPLRWLGDISYATYLVHYFAFILFKIVFVGPDLQVSWGQLSLFLGAVLIMSAILYYGFEKPAQLWMNKRVPSKKSDQLAHDSAA